MADATLTTRLAVGLACLGLLSACRNDGNPTGPTIGGFTFSGVVRDYESQRTRAGARVRFVPEVENPSGSGFEATTALDGRYALTVPRADTYTALVDGVPVGLARVGNATYRGDLFTGGGTCAARYGTISESQTQRPVVGATVALAGTLSVTDATGWYRLDLGCPDVVLPGGTTFMTITHPAYEDRSQVVGRGVSGVARLDVDMTRR